MPDFLEIDGRLGEGGGQILRTSLALSVITGHPVHLSSIRANRAKPGLARQHLTAVRAAAKIANATVKGDELRSTELWFTPTEPTAGGYHFDIGTAGSTTLLLQTILPILAGLPEPSEISLRGGTHNGMSPPVDFLTTSFLPLIEPLGWRATLALERRGFYPAGGGNIRVGISPRAVSHSFGDKPLRLIDPVTPKARRAVAVVANLPRHIAEREIKLLSRRLSIAPEFCEIIEDSTAHGPGNVCWVEVEAGSVRTVFSAVGEQGKTAERVAASVAREVKAFLKAGVPVDEHLADQLLLPLALGPGGEYNTMTPTPHTRTNAEVIRRFLDVEIRFEQFDDTTHRVVVKKPE